MSKKVTQRVSSWDAAHQIEAHIKMKLSDGWAFSGFAVCTIEDIHAAAYDYCFMQHPSHATAAPTQDRYFAYVSKVLELLGEQKACFRDGKFRSFYDYAELCEIENKFHDQLAKLMAAKMTDQEIM